MIVLLGHNVDAPSHRTVDKTLTILETLPGRGAHITKACRGWRPFVTSELSSPWRTGWTIHGERLVDENPHAEQAGQVAQVASVTSAANAPRGRERAARPRTRREAVG
jgi:hypothetical protein